MTGGAWLASVIPFGCPCRIGGKYVVDPDFDEPVLLLYSVLVVLV
ncbi:MAG TPA: hypothetical protein VFU63_03865 [Ktedonobacterales bacterium]|nr:hypothetical protein [Ktedonobacterales bacterium]